jgi:hypothetical protein
MIDNQSAWNAIAEEYDARMNDDGNDFHLTLIFAICLAQHLSLGS